jgi:hypothetical protein
MERWASGMITSPNYPNDYNHNATCVTRIKVPDDKRILLAFQIFSLEHGSRKSRFESGFRSSVATFDCTNDRLTVSFKRYY